MGRGAFLLALAVLAAVAGWFLYVNGCDTVPVAVQATPPPITARGDLAADERNNIDVFKPVSPSVVHITTRRNDSRSAGEAGQARVTITTVAVGVFDLFKETARGGVALNAIER